MNRSLRKYQKLVIAEFNKRVDRLFPSLTAVRLLEALGATFITIDKLQYNGRSMKIMVSCGGMLRSENFKLEYMDGKPFLVNDTQMVIGLEDDRRRDILAEQAYDEWLAENGFIVRWIPARWLSDPMRVKETVGQFIYS